MKELLEEMSRRFDLSDTKALCFDLGIEYQDLVYETRLELLRSLVLYCMRNGKINELQNLCLSYRNKVNWEVVFNNFIVQYTESQKEMFKNKSVNL